MVPRLEEWSKHEIRIVMRFFNEGDMSAEEYVVKQTTIMGSMRCADRVWQYGGVTLEQDKSVKTIVRAADNPQQQPCQTRRHVRQVQYFTTGAKNKTFTLSKLYDNI
jgi:hypothetical protein